MDMSTGIIEWLSIRVRCDDVDGQLARLSSHAEDPFAATRGGFDLEVGREYEISAWAERDAAGRIITAEIFECELVEDGDPLLALRAWFKEACRFGLDLRRDVPVEAELRYLRGESEDDPLLPALRGELLDRLAARRDAIAERRPCTCQPRELQPCERSTRARADGGMALATLLALASLAGPGPVMRRRTRW